MSDPNPLTLRYLGRGRGAFHREIPVCDFCLQIGAVGYYQLPPDRMKLADANVNGKKVPVLDRDGQWGACSLCQALIEAGDFEGLIRRVRSENSKDLNVVGSPERLRRLYKQWRAVRGSSQFIPDNN